MLRARSVVAALIAGLVGPGAIAAQSVRGRIVDEQHAPLNGALVEIRDSTGKSIAIVLTAASGGFVVPVPAPGHYRWRTAAIGYRPHPLADLVIPAAGLVLPEVVMVRMTMRLPDLIAVGRGKFCGKEGMNDETFSRILESAHTALQVIETAIQTHQVAFEVARINTRTLYGSFNNYEIADTAIQPLASWPVQSIDPDTLRVFGFGRTLRPGDENSREYYGPDARVLFSDWFIDGHCFTVDKPKKKQSGDSLHLRFLPAHKSKLIDVGGELVLDANNLALLEFNFNLKNLPSWMPEDAAGGNMQFARLDNGLWMTKSWTIWAPVAAVSPYNRRYSVGGQMETYGWVLQVMKQTDSTKHSH